MKNPIIRWLAPAALALLLVVSGCEMNPTSADDNEDQAAILSLIGEEVDFFDSNLFSAQGAEDPTTPAKVLADIVPWRYGRQILGVDKDISVTTDNTTEPATAQVSWTVIKTGVFHIIDSSATAYSKDFTDTMMKFATFERRGPVDSFRRGWRLVSISGTEIVSDGATVGIESVNLSSTGGVDTIFSDVSTLVTKENIQVFASSDTVTITVTTNNTDDIVLLHYPAWMMGHHQRNHVRRQLINNGDGTYTGTWVVRGQVWRNGHRRNPPRHITVDVLSHGTIYTDNEPYDSIAWGFVYLVAGQ